MPNFSTISDSASSRWPPENHGAETADQRNSISYDLTMRFNELESQIDLLKEEKRRLLARNMELEKESHDQRRLLEEKDVAVSEMAKEIENVHKEKMKVDEVLDHRVLKLEEAVARIAVDGLGSNVHHKGTGNSERSGPKSVGIEKKPCNPKTDAQIIEISDDDDEEEEEEKQMPSFASPSTTKRKSEKATWSAEKQDEAAKRCRFNGPTDAKLWQNVEQMKEALKSNDELCMKSICALYRKHNSLGVWKNQKDGNRGFLPILATRGVALGKILTNGDPEGRMRMSVADLVQQDPIKGITHCKLIAVCHDEDLFEIYRDNMDPLYLP